MNDISNTEILTLEDLQQRRAEALEELRTQKQVMSDTARNLFAPIAPAADKGTAIMRAFNTGMAVFDGAMLGIKLMRKIRKTFLYLLMIAILTIQVYPIFWIFIKYCL